MMTGSCEICGNLLVPKKRGKPRFCGSVCRRKAEGLQRLEKKKKNGARVVGGTDKCADCGQVFVLKGRKSIRCDNCKDQYRLVLYQRYNASEVRKERLKQRRKTDPKYALDRRMSWSVWYALESEKSSESWETLVGFSLSDLIRHLERQFTDGMSWDNMGDWHIDHIVPLASFKYESSEDAEFRAAWAITNLRPLWSKENVSKGARRLLLI